MKDNIASLQSALADAVGALASADAHLLAANAPDSDASPEEYAALQTARDTAKRDLDVAEANLSSALAAQRREYELDCLLWR